MVSSYMKDKRFLVVIHVLVLLMIAFPLISLLTSIRIYPIELSSNSIVIDAIIVSGKTSIITMIIVIIIGTPIAYLNARLDYKGKQALEIVLDLPLVLPPAVAGLLLLMTFGKNGIVGQFLFKLGWQIPFSMYAVVLAQLFVALPLYIKTASEGFRKVDTTLEKTAMTLGDTRWKVFTRISLPLAKESLLVGAIMAWARSIAEFGATIMFAGNMPKVTQTLPLAIYSAMESDMTTSLNIARIMVIISVTILLILYKISRKVKGGS